MLWLNMSPQKNIKFPPLTPSQRERVLSKRTVQAVQTPEEGACADAASVQPAVTRQQMTVSESSYIYATPGRKPQLLVHLESYVNKQLQPINPCEPKYEELKLQVYRSVFGIFIKEFKTYKPLLSAIKKEYENTLACQQDQIQELEPLKSHLRLVTEECDRKIQVRWEEEQAEIGALKKEKHQLQEEIEAMRKKEKNMEAVVEHLQSELSKQYLQYREECDARKLLIWQLNDQTRGSVKQEHAANGDEDKDPVVLQLALKVCRQDLTKAQEELNRMKAEYWDVVPRRNWDMLEQTHKQTLLQLKTLQGQFDQLKGEYETLLEIHTKETTETQTVQIAESMSQGQSQTQPNQGKETVSSASSASGTHTAQEFRTIPRTAFPLKSDEEIYELVPSAENEPDRSNNAISTQRLHNPIVPTEVAELDVADLTSIPDKP